MLTGQPPAPRRAVVLGASNVYRNLGTVVATAQATWGRPLELLIAAGHGRSYGLWNSVLGYSVPGIVHCGLWDAFDARRDVPTAALITDVGNDLLYGASVDTILGWIETCLERLRPHCEQIVVSELPLASVARLRESHYLMLRRILFPPSRMSLAEAIALSNCLNAGLVDLGKKFSASVVAPCDAWYGFDPIHVRRVHACAAWNTMLGPWCTTTSAIKARASTWHGLRLRAQRTHVQRFLGRERRTPQPAARYADGSTVSLF